MEREREREIEREYHMNSKRDSLSPRSPIVLIFKGDWGSRPPRGLGEGAPEALRRDRGRGMALERTSMIYVHILNICICIGKYI